MEEPEKIVRAAMGDFAAEMSQKNINILSTCWSSGGKAAIIKDALQVRLEARHKLSLEDMAMLADPQAYLSTEQFRHIMAALSGRRLANGTTSNGGASSKSANEERWLSAREATLRVASATGHSPASALYAIIAYVKIGTVKSRALAIKEKIHDRYGKNHKLSHNIEVPVWFWEHCTDYGSCALDWKSGVFSGTGYYKGSRLKVDLTGVEFNSAGIDILDPPPAVKAEDEIAHFPGGLSWVDLEHDARLSQTDAALSRTTPNSAEHPSEASRGGRPPADFWDDLWIEMCRKLYVGDLKPKKQCDVENAMQDWLASMGRNAAQSTIRARARKLWMVIEREDEN